MKNPIRILLKALTRNQTNVVPTEDKAMTSSSAGMNQRHELYSQRTDGRLAPLPAPSSTASASASEEPSRTFLAVLLRCLSAFNA